MAHFRLIALLPVRNEAWILPAFLSSLKGLVDDVIAIDDKSTDRSREILTASGARVLDGRDYQSLEMERALKPVLLHEGRRGGGTHFLFLDADEALTAPCRKSLRRACERLPAGGTLTMQWVTLWKSPTRFRSDDSVWSNNFKDFVFADDGETEFTEGLNHRMSRTPAPWRSDDMTHTLLPPEGAVLHFQFAAWERAQTKQAWYRCSELVRDPHNAHGINLMYRDSLAHGDDGTAEVPSEWLEGIHMPTSIQLASPDSWRLAEIFSWFDQHGVAFFEPLEIWHVAPLRARFVEDTGREPRRKHARVLADRIRRRLQQ